MSEMGYSEIFSPLEKALDHKLIEPSNHAYAVVRLDGNNFRSFTRGLEKPYDSRFIHAMDETALYLAEKISGIRFALVQSDEISLFFPTGALQQDENMWFGGRIQKIVSVTASMAAAKFATVTPYPEKFAAFDARVFQLATVDLAADYAMYRRNEGRKNAITMAASTVLSHKQLMGMSTGARREAYESAGRSFDDLPPGFLNGRMLTRETYETVVEFVGRGGVKQTAPATRYKWVISPVVNDILKLGELLS